MSEHYIPTAYDLAVGGNPFAYGAVSVSTVTRSQTEAFNTGINARDLGQCIICGYGDPSALEHAHIIPKVEDDTVCSHLLLSARINTNSRQWADLKTRGFIPSQCKSVEHETRNGILLCCNHHRIFDAYKFYIRWVPDVRSHLPTLAPPYYFKFADARFVSRTAPPIYSHKPLGVILNGTVPWSHSQPPSKLPTLAFPRRLLNPRNACARILAFSG